MLGLCSTLDEVLGLALPVMVKAVLLPFEGAIITDGLIRSYPVSLGSNIRRSLRERYAQISARKTVRTRLDPASDAPPGPVLRALARINKRHRREP